MNVYLARVSHHIWRRSPSTFLWLQCDLPGRHLRHASNVPVAASPDVRKTRNIGIIAHIDAGKTTTTERMLYYSGYTRRIGEVDEGSTVTDFLPAERRMGITIQSAAVTFHWPPREGTANTQSLSGVPRSQVTHTINLIDTPGHVDFTFEVTRSLRILDGAVCILDGVAGIEAQTEKVWAQASSYNIPRIIFVNKMDREGAAFGRTVREIGSRLHGLPAVCQIPWREKGKGRFIGVGDAVELCALQWTEGGDGKGVKKYTLEDLAETNQDLAVEIRKARSALIEVLCEFDEELLSMWVELSDSLIIPPQAVREALRRSISDGSGKLIPVFAGASRRNIGVQPLLDAINDLLPDPTERPDPEISIGSFKGSLSGLIYMKLQPGDEVSRHVGKHSNPPTALANKIEACALAFKVVSDPRRGVLVYVRVYSGIIKRNAALWNTSLHVTERAQRLLQMYASDAVEISDIHSGQIGVIAGLKYARTGDTLISYPGMNPKTGPPGSFSDLQLSPIEVPPPVFFASIIPDSPNDEKNVQDSLALLLREDPSLHVTVDDESQQMQINGMGELHLRIALDHLVDDFKAKAEIGSIEIGYRECVLSGSFVQPAVYDREIAGKRGRAGCEAVVSQDENSPELGIQLERDGNIITISVQIASSSDPEEVRQLPAELPPKILHKALIDGASVALARGPRRGYPLHSSHIKLTFSTITDLFGAYTTPVAVASAARLAVQAALREAHKANAIGLLEPVMNVLISCDENSLGAVIHDLSSARGGHVLSLGDNNALDYSGLNNLFFDPAKIYAPPDLFGSSDGNSGVHVGPGQQRHVTARVPLKEMLGYSNRLRSLTGGRGTFVMTTDRFERLSGHREKPILK